MAQMSSPVNAETCSRDSLRKSSAYCESSLSAFRWTTTVSPWTVTFFDLMHSP